MYMAAARLGCRKALFGTRWANSHPGCMNRLRKHYSHLVGGSFLAGKTVWALSRCLPTQSADYCMLLNEWVWLRPQVFLSCLKVHIGSALESELRQK